MCVLGDELVAGTGDPRALGWVGRVVARTPQERFRLTAHALGVPGETTTGMSDALAGRDRPAAGRHGRLVLGLGHGDLRAGTVTARSRLNVANVLDAARERGLPRLVVGPPPVLPGGPDAHLAPGRPALGDAFAEVCERRGVPYVDTARPGCGGNPDWEADLAASDGRVPGQAGYGLMAYLVLHGGWGTALPRLSAGARRRPGAPGRPLPWSPSSLPARPRPTRSPRWRSATPPRRPRRPRRRTGCRSRSARPRSTTTTCGACAGSGCPRSGCPWCWAATPRASTPTATRSSSTACCPTRRGSGDETLDPRRSLLSEVYPGTFADTVLVPRAQPRAQARRAVVRGRGVPAHGVAHRLPDAVHPVRPAPGQTVLVQGAGGGVASALVPLARRAASGSG